METIVYLHNATGNDEELTIDQVNLKTLSKGQLLWINVFRRDENCHQKCY